VRAFHVYEHQTEEKDLNRVDMGTLKVWTVPKHKVGMTNRFYITKSTTLNTQLFWSDDYFTRDTVGLEVDDYFRMDFRLSQKVWKDKAEIAVGATNLTNRSHYEGSDNNAEVPRQFYLQFFLELFK